MLKSTLKKALNGVAWSWTKDQIKVAKLALTDNLSEEELEAIGALVEGL